MPRRSSSPPRRARRRERPRPRPSTAFGPRDLIPHGGVDGAGLPRTVQTDNTHVRRAIHLEHERLEARRLDHHRRDGTFARSTVSPSASRTQSAPRIRTSAARCRFRVDARAVGRGRRRRETCHVDLPRPKCGPPTSSRRTPPTRAHPPSRTQDISSALLERIYRPPDPRAPPRAAHPVGSHRTMTRDGSPVRNDDGDAHQPRLRSRLGVPRRARRASLDHARRGARAPRRADSALAPCSIASTATPSRL